VDLEVNPDDVLYEFMDGVRDLLVDSVPSGYVLNVVDEVSKYVAKRVGLSLQDFAAVLRNPQAIAAQENASNFNYFATVTAQILRSLGGEYEKIADEIKERLDVETIKIGYRVDHIISVAELKEKELIEFFEIEFDVKYKLQDYSEAITVKNRLQLKSNDVAIYKLANSPSLEGWSKNQLSVIISQVLFRKHYTDILYDFEKIADENKRPRRKQRGIVTLFLTFHAPQGAGNLPVILLKKD
jgi:hypothetical protein